MGNWDSLKISPSSLSARDRQRAAKRPLSLEAAPKGERARGCCSGKKLISRRSFFVSSAWRLAIRGREHRFSQSSESGSSGKRDKNWQQVEQVERTGTESLLDFLTRSLCSGGFQKPEPEVVTFSKQSPTPDPTNCGEGRRKFCLNQKRIF